MKKGNISVNDGGGLLDNQGLCDSLIKDLNNLIKNIANGQYITFCMIVSHMTQKLMNLKKGIGNDMESKNKVIEELKSMLKENGKEIIDIPPEEFLKKEGAENVSDNKV